MTETKSGRDYLKAILVLPFAVFMLAILDYFPYPESFWLHGMVFMGLIAIIYCIFRKDISESLALFLAGVVLFWFGLEDAFFYFVGLIMGNPIPVTMVHLNAHPIISLFAMGGDVTFITIAISVAFGVAIASGILFIFRRYF